MPQNLSSLVNNLPIELLESREIFNNVINKEILNKLPKAKLNSILNKHLPANLNNEDKLRTINDLFDNQLDYLNINQMDSFYKQAKIHKFRPDLVKHMNELKLLRKQAYRFEEQKHQCKLLNEIVLRKRLLIQKVLSSSPNNLVNKNDNSALNCLNESLNQRVDDRYCKELERINLEDLNGEEGDLKSKINSALSTKSDDEEQSNLNAINYSVDKSEYLKMLKNFKRKKSRDEIKEEDFKSLSVKSILDRVLENPSPSFRLEIEQSKSLKRNKKITKGFKKSTILNGSKDKATLLDKRSLDNHLKEDSKSDTNVEQSINQEISKNKCESTFNQLKLSPSFLSSSICVKENEHINKLANGYDRPPLSFFSLIRDVFYKSSTNEFKLTLHKLEELVKQRLKALDPKLAASGWQKELVQSAMNFLSEALIPPKNVPLVDYKEKNQQWQWIGTDNDDDQVLIQLTNDWINELNRYSLLNPNQQIPPSIHPTNWQVEESSSFEKEQYRKQEELRYKNASKAFTFNLHGYNSTVGPVKGSSANSSNSTSKHKEKPETHLLKERPPFITLLSLVRDSCSRLPNGEGTRQDISTLLKDSQYLREDITDEQISGLVSGALDRLHYEKDPCIKFDDERKIWIYQHRYREEADFNRLHKRNMDANLAKKNLLSNKPVRKALSVNKSATGANMNSSSNGQAITIAPKRKTTDNNVQIGANQIKNKLSQEAIRIEKTAINHLEPNRINSKQSDKLVEQISPNNSAKKESIASKKKLNTTRKVASKKSKIAQKIEENSIDTTITVSSLKSDSITKSTKPKYQKKSFSNKKLKTEQQSNEPTIKIINCSNIVNSTTNTTLTPRKQSDQIKISGNNFTVPILNNNAKIITKDDVNKIVIQPANRINLSANGGLILSPSNNSINGFTSFNLINPQTFKGKIITNPSNQLSIQNMRIVPLAHATANSLTQQLNPIKTPPIITKAIIPKDSSQINLSTSNSAHQQSIIMSCSPKFAISSKTNN